MANNPKIVKRMINGERAGIFHSSAYGRAQSGSTMGAASSESFAERRKVDENRQNIRKYSDSMVAEQRFNSEAVGATRLDNPAKVGSEDRQAKQQSAGIGAARTKRADLYKTAEKRAEMSARFAGRTGRTGRTGAGQNGNAGRTPMAPRATRPPRGL